MKGLILLAVYNIFIQLSFLNTNISKGFGNSTTNNIAMFSDYLLSIRNCAKINLGAKRSGSFP